MLPVRAEEEDDFNSSNTISSISKQVFKPHSEKPEKRKTYKASAIATPLHSPLSSQCSPNAVPKLSGIAMP